MSTIHWNWGCHIFRQSQIFAVQCFFAGCLLVLRNQTVLCWTAAESHPLVFQDCLSQNGAQNNWLNLTKEMNTWYSLIFKMIMFCGSVSTRLLMKHRYQNLPFREPAKGRTWPKPSTEDVNKPTGHPGPHRYLPDDHRLRWANSNLEKYSTTHLNITLVLFNVSGFYWIKQQLLSGNWT